MDLQCEADAPPRKPKQPFLKRGEGVKRRLDAYKYRKPLAVEDGSHIEEEHLSEIDQGQQHGQHVGQYGATAQHSAPQAVGEDRVGLNLNHQDSSVVQGTPSIPQEAAATWATRQAKEDLELEEFRALEREIWGGRQQQPVQKHEQRPADKLPASTSTTAHNTAEAAEAAASAAYDSLFEDTANSDVDLGQSSSSQLITFEDDTEWVDTEFSFSGMPDQIAAAANRSGHWQQEQHHLREHPRSDVTCEPGADGALAQPYVRTVFATKGLKGSRLQTSGSKMQSRQTSQHLGATAPHEDDAAGLQDAQQPMVMVPVEQVQTWQQLEQAQPDLQKQQDDLRRMRHELKSAATRLEQERQAWETQKASAQASMDAWRSEEARRLARERRVLEQQSKALLKLPSKKEKSAMEALEQQLEKERAEARAAAARHKLTVERLRCQIKELQDRNCELREEVRWHEAQQLNATAFAAADAKARRRLPTSVAQTQTEAWLIQDTPGAAAAAAAEAATAAALRIEAGVTQQQAAASAPSTSLYEALFGEDDEDTQFAAAEAMAAAAAAAAESDLDSAQPKLQGAKQSASLVHQQYTIQQSNGLHCSKAGPSHRNSSSSSIQQQQPAAVGAQLGRKIEHSVTVKGRHDWVDGPHKQYHIQHQQQTVQIAPAVQPSGARRAVPNGRSEPRGGQGQADDDFTFAPVAPQAAAAAASGTSAWEQQQQPQVQQSNSASSSNQHDAGLDNRMSSRRHDRVDQYSHDTQPQLPTGSAGVVNSRPQPPTAAGNAADLTRTQTNRPALAAARRTLVQESQHADGKLEQLFSDGSRVLHFANGTVKSSYSDGSTCIRFSNGDIKRQTAEGRVDYYYAEVATWQSSHPDSVEVFYFPTGQVEGHYGNGKMDIIFPDGSIRRVLPDGSEQEITAALLPAAVQLPPPDLDNL